MKAQIKPQTLAVYSALLFMQPALAQMAPNGANGVNTFINGGPVSLIGETNYGATGNMTQSGSQATNGADVSAVNSKKISISNVKVDGSVGLPGQIGGLYVNVPGSGGNAGAFVLGGGAIGGLGGVRNFQGSGSVAGGSAGGASDNAVDISNSGFVGAQGGRGADGSSAAGLGGMGGPQRGEACL